MEELNNKLECITCVEKEKFEVEMIPLRAENNEMKKQLDRLKIYINRILGLKDNADNYENWVNQIEKRYNQFERGVKLSMKR